jgi:hypothetical protein
MSEPFTMAWRGEESIFSYYVYVGMDAANVLRAV